MDVNETLLPGVGIRYELVTEGGSHVGVIARRDEGAPDGPVVGSGGRVEAAVDDVPVVVVVGAVTGMGSLDFWSWR